jgi:hypothetical protein
MTENVSTVLVLRRPVSPPGGTSWNWSNREAKSPCDKNIRYPVCVPGHDLPNGTTFLTIKKIVVYDKQKTALVDDRSDLIVSGPKAFWPGDNLHVLV